MFLQDSDGVRMDSILRYSAGRGLPSKACCPLSPPTHATSLLLFCSSALHGYLEGKGFCTDLHLTLSPLSYSFIRALMVSLLFQTLAGECASSCWLGR